MLLSPSRRQLLPNTIVVGFEKLTQKEMTTAIDKYCFDNASQAYLTPDTDNKSILIYNCQVKKINPSCKCTFQIVAKRIRRCHEDIFRIESAYLEHGEYCVGVKPQPSLEYLLQHQAIKAYAIHNKPSKILQYANLSYNFQLSQSMASRLKAEASKTFLRERFILQRY